MLQLTKNGLVLQGELDDFARTLQHEPLCGAGKASGASIAGETSTTNRASNVARHNL